MEAKLKRGVLTGCLLLSFLPFVVLATDGTWASASAGGAWGTAANWVDGQIPGEGGVATFNLLEQTGSIVVTGSGTIELSAIDITSVLPWNSNYNSVFKDMLFHFVPPARVSVDGGCFNFYGNTLSCDGDFTVAKKGRCILNSPQQLNGRLIISNGWVRAVADTSLGPAPSTLVADAIILDGGILQNGGPTTLSANRGITVAARGGTFAAGYTTSYLKVPGPVTGPGDVRIAYENQPVYFYNTANDWSGDLVVGVLDCGDPALADFRFVCGADEVVPHGPGKGRLILAPDGWNTNRFYDARFDLDGHTESVNAVESSRFGRIISTAGGGTLNLVSDADSDFAGRLDAGITMAKYGAGTLAVTGAWAAVSGEIALHAGNLALAAAGVTANGRVTLWNGAATIVPQEETSGAVTGGPAVYTGVIDVRTNMTLVVDSAAEPFVFGGRLVTDPEDPKTLTFDTASGAPLLIGGTSSATSAVIDAPVACPDGIVATNFVWLKQELPADAVVAPGTTITCDYAGALEDDVTLMDTDLRVTTAGLGNGTIFVPTGRTVIFSTQSEEGGVFVDPADGTRTYANAVVLQGGTLAFDGSGITTFSGNVSGYGTIRQEGTGSVIFGNGAGLESGCTIVITAGNFRVPAGGSLGAATIRTAEGALANVAGEDVMIPNTIIASAGGVRVEGADATMILTGRIVHDRNISKWGDGTLRIGGDGTVANTFRMHVRGGTLALARPSAIGYIIGCELGATIRLESDGELFETGSVALDGGTLDLNGHDLELTALNVRNINACVTNGAAADATLTVASDASAAYPALFASGVGKLYLAFTGTGTRDLTRARLANAGISASAGGLTFAGNTNVVANLLRFYPTAARPGKGGSPEYAGSGIQFSEFRLLKGGAPVAWPEGTTAWAARPATGEVAANTIDGSTGTKWYASGAGTPLIITCGDAVEFDAYQFATANDAIGRDPITWTLDVGTVSGATTNWITVDAQVNVSNDVPIARWEYVTPYSVAKTLRQSVLPAGYELHLDSAATATFGWCGETFTALSGTGTLVATDGAWLTLTDGSTFSGTVVSDGDPIRLAYSSAAIPGVAAGTAETALVNNGVAGALTFGAPGVYNFYGSALDGTAAIGLDVGAGATLAVHDAESTHTGGTTVRAGGTITTTLGLYARYFRFYPYKSTDGYGGNTQLSELQLVVDGTRIPWPEETVGTTTGDNSGKNEGAMQLLDGNVNTKCYWGGTAHPVLITAPEAVYFEGYRWYTANDSMTTRNPVSWRFEYSMDGENWTILDEQVDRPTVTTTLTLAYTFDLAENVPANFNAISDSSAISLQTGGTCEVARVEETLGPLSGTGTLRITRGGTARLAVAGEATFAGGVSGVGVLAKAGAGTQTLSGPVALAGEIVVEAGVLNLDGVQLTGVTNIVLRGGTLTGTATCTGDLTVTGAGGLYAASIAVSGTLSLQGSLSLALPQEPPFSWTSFTFGSLASGSAAVFEAATVMGLAEPQLWQVNCRAGNGKLTFSVQKGALTIIIR